MTDEDRPGLSHSILATALLSYEDEGPERENAEDMLRGDFKDGRFLLIERNVRGFAPGVWFTRHDTLDEAAEYNFNQEYAEDWEIVEAVDLLDGSHWTVADKKVHVDWEQAA